MQLVRTQIYLSVRQHRALQRRARQEGVSMTALLRKIVEERLVAKPTASKEEALSFVGLGASGWRDTAAHHDQALDEAFRAGHLR